MVEDGRMTQFTVAALYQFVSLPDYKELQPKLKTLGLHHDIRGTLLLAQEGINGTVAGTRKAIDALCAFLKEDGRFDNLEYKESWASKMPFHRLKVRLKKEIVTLGIPSVDPTKQVGTYLSPKAWNKLLEDPEVVLIDTRNTYEYEIGTFKGALNPETSSFRQFPDYVKNHFDPKKTKKVAMFCTGGIRCEKASSYMLQEGFEEVYHLKGGILKYLEEVKPEESLWEGECFVFDHRTAITHGLEEGQFQTCFGCRTPISPQDKESLLYKQGVHCPKCYATASPERIRKSEERHKQIQLAKQRGQNHFSQ